MKHYRIQKDTNVYFSTCTIVQWQCIFKEEKTKLQNLAG